MKLPGLGFKCPEDIYSVLSFCSSSHCCLWPEAPEPQEDLGEVTYWILTSILQIWKGKYLALQEWDTWMLVYWQTIIIFEFSRNILLIRHEANPEVPTWGAALWLVFSFRSLSPSDMVIYLCELLEEAKGLDLSPGLFCMCVFICRDKSGLKSWCFPNHHLCFSYLKTNQACSPLGHLWGCWACSNGGESFSWEVKIPNILWIFFAVSVSSFSSSVIPSFGAKWLNTASGNEQTILTDEHFTLILWCWGKEHRKFPECSLKMCFTLSSHW